MNVAARNREEHFQRCLSNWLRRYHDINWTKNIAECVTLNSHEKKSDEYRNKEQRRAFSELSFELNLTLWLQWFCKIPFPDSTYFELKVLVVECAFLESYEKNLLIVAAQQATEKSIFRVIFRIGVGIMTTIILQNNISRFNFFWIESFDSWVCYFGMPQKKNLLNVAAKNREEHF